MPSIGPQLPPHLQKRKRTPEPEEGRLNPPPSKVARSAPRNGDDDSDDDSYGASAPGSLVVPRAGPAPAPTPAPASRAQSTIGPSLPPHLMNAAREDGNEDGDDDDSKRASPQSLARTKPIGPSPSSSSPPAPAPARRILGPSLPPGPLDERPTTGPGPDDSDSDGDYGPALPNRNQSAITAAAAAHRSSAYATAPAALTRDDWMVAPPTAADPRAPADPTQLRNRKFTSGRSVRPAGDGGSGGSMWTETADEKRRRLADAVLGRGGSGGVEDGGGSTSSHKASSRREDAERVQSYVEQTRGRSLLEEHVAARREGRVPGASARDRDRDRGRDRDRDRDRDRARESGRKTGGRGREGGGGGGEKGGGEVERNSDGAPVVEEEDDPSKRVFDKERDMKVGGLVSGVQRREFLARAADFGGRFKSGKYL